MFEQHIFEKFKHNGHCFIRCSCGALWQLNPNEFPDYETEAELRNKHLQNESGVM